MSLADASATRTWRYIAIDGQGRRIQNSILAQDARSAVRALADEGLTPVSLEEERASSKPRGLSDRHFRFSERVLVLQQFGLMVEAGVGLLDALRTVISGLDAAKGRNQLDAVASALTRGETFSGALETHAPGFPGYVYAMCRVGQATGRLGEVLRSAADQMSYEDRLRRDFVNAMTYPTFLLSAGFFAVLFIFTQVVPRFSQMVGDNRAKMPLASRLILDLGNWANTHLVGLLIGVGSLIGLAVLGARNAQVRTRAYNVMQGAPLLGDLLRSREIATWARLMNFSLANGVLLLDAAILSRSAAPPGRFRSGLEQIERDLRAGLTLEATLGRHTRLTAMDLSLLRTGQKAGALPRMFGFLAEAYESRLRDLMRRLTALVEPLAIGMISIIVGIVAISLVLALSSVYESVF